MFGTTKKKITIFSTIFFICCFSQFALAAEIELKGWLATIPLLCGNGTQAVVTYADRDGDGVNDMQIALFPTEGYVVGTYFNGQPMLYFTFIADECDITSWQTLHGNFVVRFIDATAPGWVYNNPNTWTELKIPQVRTRFSHDLCNNYLQYYGVNDPRNVPNTNPYQRMYAYENFNRVNQVDTAEGCSSNECSLESSTGISELFLTTDFCENDLESLILVTSVNTPSGSNVSVPIGDSTITFDQVTAPGNTTITQSTSGHPLPSGSPYSLCNPPVYFEINTTATYQGNIQVCLKYDDTVCDESSLKLVRWVQICGISGCTWTFTDVTTSLDTTANIICGQTTHLSQYSLVSSNVPNPCGNGTCDAGETCLPAPRTAALVHLRRAILLPPQPPQAKSTSPGKIMQITRPGSRSSGHRM